MNLFLEDLDIGYTAEVGPFTLTSQEIREFALKWDPQPFHLRADLTGEFGSGQIASGLHTLVATFHEFVTNGIFTGNVVIGKGFEKIWFLQPVRPGQELHASTILLDRRPSLSKPHLGILRWKIMVRHVGELMLEAEVVNFIKSRGGSIVEPRAEPEPMAPLT